MNAFLLLIPLILIRYGLLGLLSKEALRRAAFFPPLDGNKRMAQWFYLVSNISMFVYLFFLQIRIVPVWFYTGLLLYGLGILFYTVSVCNYANPIKTGINTKGLYRFSRNPMYVAYFIYFAGCVLLTQSWILLLILCVFQISSHWVILAEENWCIKEFGEEYIKYMKKVRRYV